MLRRELIRCGDGERKLRLLRIQLNHQALVEVLAAPGALRRPLDRASQFLYVVLDPRRETDLLGELQGVDDSQLCLGSLFDCDDVAGPHQSRGNVEDLAIHRHRAMAHELARFGARRAETHAVDDVIETRLEESQQVVPSRSLALRSHPEVTPELPLENAVGSAQLLLLAQLIAIARLTHARAHAMLARLGVELALGVERPARAFQEKVGAFAP